MGPLDGFVVAVTAGRRADEQAELLCRRGAEVVLAAAISTSYLAEDARLRQATTEVIANRPGYVVVTTGIGFRAWVEAAQASGLDGALLGALRAARIVTRGPKATAAVRAAQLEAWATSGDERLSGVRAALGDLRLEGVTIAVQCDGSQRSGLDGLAASHGASLLEVPVYRWRLPDDTGPLERAIAAGVEGRLHAFTFTSAPAVGNIMRVAAARGLEGPLLAAFRDRLVAGCVGPVSADAARRAGIDNVVTPERGRLGLLVRALADRLAATATETDVGDRLVRLQGRFLAVGGRRVQLAWREAAALEVLLHRPGAVVSRPELLRRAWPAGAAGEHAVDVAVARLRPRLEAVGLRVDTVRRRGYRVVATPGG